LSHTIKDINLKHRNPKAPI